jgi:hypothetical protein
MLIVRSFRARNIERHRRGAEEARIHRAEIGGDGERKAGATEDVARKVDPWRDLDYGRAFGSHSKHASLGDINDVLSLLYRLAPAEGDVLDGRD